MRQKISVPLEGQTKVRVWRDTLPRLRGLSKQHGLSQPQLIDVALTLLEEQGI